MRAPPLVDRSVRFVPSVGRVLKRHLTERQRKVMVALYRGQAFRRGMGCSVRSLVERRFLPDSRYAGPLAGLEEAGLVASDRKPVNRSRPSFSLWWLTSAGRGAAQGLSNRYPDREPGRTTVRLLEADGALAHALDERSRLEAEPRAVAEVVAVEPGAWTLEPRREDWRRGLGLLVLDGLLAGEVKVKKRSFLELLGPGDLLRPWTYRPGARSLTGGAGAVGGAHTRPLCRARPRAGPPAGPVARGHRGAAGPGGRAITLAGGPVCPAPGG